MELHIKSPTDTDHVAKIIANHARAGFCLLLDGELGVGKTYLTQAIARSLNYNAVVTSPTFSIANIYQCPNLSILHIDAYRLEDYHEFADLGLEEEISQSLSVIEWSQKISPYFREFIHIQMAFAKSQNARILSITHKGTFYDALVNDLQKLGGSI